MQNPIQKISQSSIVFEKPGFLSEKLKLQVPQTIFFTGILHTFPT